MDYIPESIPVLEAYCMMQMEDNGRFACPSPTRIPTRAVGCRNARVMHRPTSLDKWQDGRRLPFVPLVVWYHMRQQDGYGDDNEMEVMMKFLETQFYFISLFFCLFFCY